MTNLLYLIDIRSRYCEVGAFFPTESRGGVLILRRLLSMGSLWGMSPGEGTSFPAALAVSLQGYQARSSAGFTEITSFSLLPQRFQNVAAVIESGGKTRVGAFAIAIMPAGTKLYLPEKQPVQYNAAVTAAAYEALKFKASRDKILILEGQSNTLQYAELILGEESEEIPRFQAEHKPGLADLIIKELENGRLWAEHAPDELSAMEVLAK